MDSMEKFIYAVLGAGRQGQAIAYDLACFGDAKEIFLFDQDSQRLSSVQKKISRLTKKNLTCVQLPFPEGNEIILRMLADRNINVVSSLPYRFNKECAELALKARANFCDLGGNTDIAWQELDLNRKAKKAGISIIPDCGLMPGAGNILAAYALKIFGECDGIKIYVGGLPQKQNSPLGYRLNFSAEGLINEYLGKANILRNGSIVQIDALSEVEPIYIPETGVCEAFITSGGTSTAPWSFKGKVKNYLEKTIRYCGHLRDIRLLKELGLLDEAPLMIENQKMAPRKFLETLLEKKIGIASNLDRRDIVIFILEADGKIRGKNSRFKIKWIDYYDDATEFTAMERTTGFSAAIVAIMQARGETPKGALPPEVAVNPERFLEELRKRGFNININPTAKSI